MDSLTVTSRLLSPTGDKALTPAMVTALWVIADEIDQKSIKTDARDAVWLEIPSARLRGEGARSDNIWLRECLDRMTGIKISGHYRGDPWGAVVLAEWHIEQGGAMTRLLVPPAAINALRAPDTFAKIEAHAAYKLDGHARRLYAVLADKKRLAQKYWTFSLDELRSIFDVEAKTSYQRFNNFRQWVLDPALAQINDFGTVTVTMTPEKVGRAVSAIRFDWKWKTIDEARETEEENLRLDIARRTDPKAERYAPPLFEQQSARDPNDTPEARAALVERLRAEGKLPPARRGEPVP